jgi:hypothetical protein
MNQFLERQKLVWFIQEEIIWTVLYLLKKIESIITFQNQKTPTPGVFTSEFCQIYKIEIIPTIKSLEQDKKLIPYQHYSNQKSEKHNMKNDRSMSIITHKWKGLNKIVTSTM